MRDLAQEVMFSQLIRLIKGVVKALEEYAEHKANKNGVNNEQV